MPTCSDFIKDYCSNCTFAGVHFIADDTKHWIERLVWLVLVILSWYGSAVLIIAAWDAFIINPISFGVETTYTEWNTEMPTVAICESANDDKVYNVSDTIWPPDHLLDLEDALKDIAFFRGVSYSLIEICYNMHEPDPLCPKSNYSYYAKLVRSDCPTIIRNCSYNDRPFSCCEYFQPLDTDLGPCFILNSIQVKNPKPFPMVSNRVHKRGVIKFQILVPTTVYTIGPEEVPSITTLQYSTLKVHPGHKYRRLVTVRNIENDPLVVETTSKQRACRFYHENEDGLYPHYSYSACTVLCRKRAQMEICHCNDHFMLGTTPAEHCNISGMACLHGLASHLTTLKPHWASRPGLTCDCLPSCNETEITVVKDGDTPNGKGNKKKAEIELTLAYLPTERFKRNVVRSRLDLVVSIGGTTGLFVGASLLSFVELIFYFTIRFANDIWMERQKRKPNAVNKLQNTASGTNIRIEDVNALEGIPKGPYENSGVGNLRLLLPLKSK
ncbi:sodium channel protein Nach [Ostrinia nubilalis]|uniref:sodium channel protein Nach n=1 Tax=Ostrinia nubilalis TaxID=29057 RepID=UPI00308248ED